MDDVTAEDMENMYNSIYDDNASDMRGIFSVLFTYLLMYVTADEQTKNDTNLVEFVGQGLQKELQTVKQPIDESIAFIGSSQCKRVKRLIGVSYEQLQGDSGPDLNSLTLVYKTRLFSKIINITTAPETLRQYRSFDAQEKLIIFLHGFTDDPTKNSFQNISESLLNKGHVGVLALDASSLIRWLYLRATTCVRFIGERLGEVLASMVYKGQDPDLIHIIGHSLGAHIAGFAGKTFYNLTGKVIGRISGLDPAGPCFSNVVTDCRLNDTDAKFVDILHSDAGVYGIKAAVGQADYYPNNGAMQPNCVLQTCSHSRSWLLYSISILFPDAFPAIKCKDWEEFKKGECENEISYMGYAAEPTANGRYYLQTNGKYPFFMGVDGIMYKNTDGILKNIQSFFGW